MYYADCFRVENNQGPKDPERNFDLLLHQLHKKTLDKIEDLLQESGRLRQPDYNVN